MSGYVDELMLTQTKSGNYFVMVERLGAAMELLLWWRGWELQWYFGNGGEDWSGNGAMVLVERLGVGVAITAWSHLLVQLNPKCLFWPLEEFKIVESSLLKIHFFFLIIYISWKKTSELC